MSYPADSKRVDVANKISNEVTGIKKCTVNNEEKDEKIRQFQRSVHILLGRYSDSVENNA